MVNSQQCNQRTKQASDQATNYASSEQKNRMDGRRRAKQRGIATEVVKISVLDSVNNAMGCPRDPARFSNLCHMGKKCGLPIKAEGLFPYFRAAQSITIQSGIINHQASSGLSSKPAPQDATR